MKFCMKKEVMHLIGRMIKIWARNVNKDRNSHYRSHNNQFE